MKNTKLILLFSISFLTILGLIITFFVDTSSLVKATISILGGDLIILMAVLIGFEGVRFFTIKSAMGKALMFLSLGLISWGIGNFFWLYLTYFSNIEVPYPSLADVGYLGMIPFAAYGLFLILQSIKPKFDAFTLLKIILSPLIVTVLCFFLFVNSKLSENVELLAKVLNVAYPVGDIIFLSLSLVILSISVGSIIFKPLSIICVGFIFQAIADFMFSYTTSIGTYYTGCLVDILWYIAFLFIGLGMHSVLKEHRNFISGIN